MSEEHAQIKTDNGMPLVQAEEQGHRVSHVTCCRSAGIYKSDIQVYIGNLPFTATEEQVREFVAPVGGEM